MISSRRESLPRAQSAARSTEPISPSWPITSAGAPPCSGPFSAPIAPQIAEARSERVAMITRAAKVLALRPCSAPAIR